MGKELDGSHKIIGTREYLSIAFFYETVRKTKIENEFSLRAGHGRKGDTKLNERLEQKQTERVE